MRRLFFHATQLTLGIGAVLFSLSASAGFSIAVKPLPPQAKSDKGAMASPVHAGEAAPILRLVVPKSARLSVPVAEFLKAQGWDVAWLAGELMAGDAKTFEGGAAEEVLVEFLRHYDLVGERFPAEKGYVIRRNVPKQEKK